MTALARPPKFVLIGAGSVSFGLMTMKDLMQSPALHGSEMVLVDIAPERLERMARLARRLSDTWQAGFRISSTTDRRAALPCADIVVVAVEQNRWQLWKLDRSIPRKHGCIQVDAENGSVGGMFHTFRQAPLLLSIARDIEQLCPKAWLVNMSNPESRLTLLLHRYSKVKNVGVCLGAYITRHYLANRVLGLADDEVDVKAYGINHCHWVLDVRRNGTGEDLYPLVRERIESIDPKWLPLSRECLKRFGYFPGPSDNHVSEYIGWGPLYVPLPPSDWAERAEQRDAEQATVVDQLIARGGPLTQEELQPLMIEAGLRWQTLDIIQSLLDNGNRYVLSLNMPNKGLITNLKQDAIIEGPAIVGADRIYGLALGEMPPAIAALLELQLRIMDLVVEAAVTGDRQTALQALLIDPGVPSPEAARNILDEMIAAEKDYLPQFA